MSRTPRLSKLSEELRNLVRETLVSGSQGMFRWVQCQVEALSRLRTDRDIRKALTRLPKTLFESYNRVLERIEEQDRPVARRALIWLSYGPQAMTLNELTEAVVVDELTVSRDKEAAWDPQDLLSIIGSLARFYPQSGAVELAHHSVKDFLESADLSPDLQCFRIDKTTGFTQIAESMLRYLLMEDFDNTLPIPQAVYVDRLYDYTLLPFAARFWPYYANNAVRTSDTVMGLCKRLFDPSVNNFFRNWVRALVTQGPNDYRLMEKTKYAKDERARRTRWARMPPAPKHLKPLYYAASFGLLPVVQYLLDAGVPVSERGGMFRGTALHAAIYRCHTDVVLLLIAAGSDLHLQDATGMTAVDMALSYNRSKEILAPLVAAGADLSAKSLKTHHRDTLSRVIAQLNIPGSLSTKEPPVVQDTQAD